MGSLANATSALIKRYLGRGSVKSPAGGALDLPAGDQNTSYWTRHTVATRSFHSRDESLDFVKWRNAQNFFREKFMPVTGHDGKVVLDYGCGPGNDLVNLLEFSKPKRLVGVDISPKALELSRERLALHDERSVAELHQIENGAPRLPFDNDTFDYVHCDGVIHHTPNPQEILAEFRRVLKPGGEARIYAYHYNSIWLHCYVAFLVRVKQGRSRNVGIREAFRHCTDGPECPISNCYTVDEFLQLARLSGLPEMAFVGSGVVVDELMWVLNRFEAIADERLEHEHRMFLRGLTFDERGIPHSQGIAAGSSACYSYIRPGRK